MKEPVIFVASFMEQFVYVRCRLLMVCVHYSVNLMLTDHGVLEMSLKCASRKLCFGTYK
jgi:hypothetical protein